VVRTAVVIAITLAACGPSFEQQVATECQGMATDTAYEGCRRRLAQDLADRRLGYIVRSQMGQR
jgi:hypothetical protein